MMELENLKPMPIDFILQRTALSWREALWGYEKKWLGWRSLIDLANRYENSNLKSADLLNELAVLGKDGTSAIRGIAEQLAMKEHDPGPAEIQQKWLYLALSWLDSRISEIPDVWIIIEEIYAEFDYPEVMRRFVPFLPVADQDKATWAKYADPKDYLREQWRKYLVTAGRKFNPHRGAR